MRAGGIYFYHLLTKNVMREALFYFILFEKYSHLDYRISSWQQNFVNVERTCHFFAMPADVNTQKSYLRCVTSKFILPTGKQLTKHGFRCNNSKIERHSQHLSTEVRWCLVFDINFRRKCFWNVWFDNAFTV